MKPSRKAHQLQIVQYILNAENNPSIWTPDSFNKMLKGEVVIGYLLKNKKSKFDSFVPILNLYTINPKYLHTKNKLLSFIDIQNAFRQWLEDLNQDTDSMIFRNPPIKEWLDTKENWCKKLAHKLSGPFNLPYEECLSTLYMSILKCYSKSHVYMGNLSYIETTVRNDLKMRLRFLQNRLTGDSPLAIHLDACISDMGGGEDSAATFHEVIGKIDSYHKELELKEILEEVTIDLKKEFSEREIDQILKVPNLTFLSMSLYRRLHKWRKNHKRSDYL